MIRREVNNISRGQVLQANRQCKEVRSHSKNYWKPLKDANQLHTLIYIFIY